MPKNMVDPEGPQMASECGAYELHSELAKSTCTHSHAHAHAHVHLQKEESNRMKNTFTSYIFKFYTCSET